MITLCVVRLVEGRRGHTPHSNTLTGIAINLFTASFATRGDR
ncbi:MAG: hypothetical protein ACI8T1_003180 [Verrucomicrobiales bacterium]|jgi:hypothetical protein